MSTWLKLVGSMVRALGSAVTTARKPAGPPASPASRPRRGPAGAPPRAPSGRGGVDGRPTRRDDDRRPSPDGGEPSAGQEGPDATVEVDPRRIGPVRMTFSPVTDGDPDPGEIVWTWVPFEENDGRGKDRPVLVVAAEPAGTVLAVQLTSKDHDGEADFVPIGSGSWDGEHRPSWVNIDRVIRVHPRGMRREATALDGTHYGRVEAALRARYGWR